MEQEVITREQHIEAFMHIFHIGRFDAEEAVAIERGEIPGDCISSDSQAVNRESLSSGQ
jgi:hypothetical protein